MLGLMQQQPLLVSSIIRFAARHHGTAEVVSQNPDFSLHRSTYAEIERRSRRLARVLQKLGVRAGDRVATLAWNGWRHVEIYYATSGMGAVCHTVNPRLSLDDIAYIMNHAEDCVLFADTSFAELVAALAPRLRGHVRTVVMMCDAAAMPELALAPGMTPDCYETLMAAADEDYAWPEFDENTASSLCYTSGTTGRPKGVLYSHRSTILHAYAFNQPDAFGARATDRIVVIAPMFHANGWSIPYGAPMAGAATILPGRHMDGASLVRLMNAERGTMASGVPTIWLDVLAHLEASGERLTTLRRVVCGGSAVPRAMLEGLAKHGVDVQQAWGMTETSPLGSTNRPTAATAHLQGDAAIKQSLNQGHGVFGVDIRIVGPDGAELPWDGVAFGDLEIRGPWICREYYRLGVEGAAAPDGWFKTGDVASIDPHGFISLVDRSKDVIKSGGEWISSITLENIAVSHPDVAEAAVIAARHPKWQERPLLLVVPKAGRTIEPASVLALYRDRVAKWWLPDAVLVVDELPHTATGKLNKLALRKQYEDHLLRQAAAD